MEEESTYGVGVIVARFQVARLHEGHRRLIDEVCSRHGKVLVFLGLAPIRSTVSNPLDFEARKQMLVEAYPKLDVHYIKNHPSDVAWSKNLDSMIEDLTTPSQTPILYGSRDSFIPHYHGKFETHELEQTIYFSGTQDRKEIANSSTQTTPGFREGVIWATTNRYPTVYSTVDCALFQEGGFDSDNHERFHKIVLGRKSTDAKDHYRFIGGFTDPRSESSEQDVRREVSEEAGVEITDPQYIGTYKVEDWRYQGEVDCIRTTFFHAHVQSGRLNAADDIEALGVFPVKDLMRIKFVPEHIVLRDALLRYLSKNRYAEVFLNTGPDDGDTE